MAINGFTGIYRWLSNYWPTEVVINDIRFPTVEHAYQAFKAVDRVDFNRIRKMPTPERAKKVSKRIKVRDDWDKVKTEVMETCLRAKFSNPIYAEKLFNTGTVELISNNDCGDTFWGVCNGIGENRLGKLLMKIRAEIRDAVLENSTRVKYEHHNTTQSDETS